MYEIREHGGFSNAFIQDDGTMYVRKNIVNRFPGKPDEVGLQGGENSDIETNGQEKEQSTDQLRRFEQRALPPDQWKAGATVNQILTIPNPHVSPQQPDWEVMASKHVLPHMLRDGYELNVDIKGKSGATDKSCLLYTSPSPRDATLSRMPSSA